MVEPVHNILVALTNFRNKSKLLVVGVGADDRPHWIPQIIIITLDTTTRTEHHISALLLIILPTEQLQ